MMPMALVQRGEYATIKRITGDGEVRRHLAELGFVVGERIGVVAELGGNMIVDVKGSRVALDRVLLRRIMV
jgi:Fe2+ transport system protein A